MRRTATTAPGDRRRSQSAKRKPTAPDRETDGSREIELPRQAVSLELETARQPAKRLPAMMIAGFRHRDLLASGQHMHLQSDWDRYRLETGGGAPRRNLDWTAPNFSHQPPNISFEPDASGDRCASLRKMEFICSRIGLPQGQGTRHRPQAAIQRSEPFPCP